MRRVYDLGRYPGESCAAYRRRSTKLIKDLGLEPVPNESVRTYHARIRLRMQYLMERGVRFRVWDPSIPSRCCSPIGRTSDRARGPP